MPIWESDKDMERAAAGKKEEGREKMAHCVIITSDIRSMNLMVLRNKYFMEVRSGACEAIWKRNGWASHEPVSADTAGGGRRVVAHSWSGHGRWELLSLKDASIS